MSNLTSGIMNNEREYKIFSTISSLRRLISLSSFWILNTGLFYLVPLNANMHWQNRLMYAVFTLIVAAGGYTTLPE